MLLNKDKISELRNSKILVSLKIPSKEKLAKASQFDVTWFYDVIISDSIFLTRFSNSRIPDLQENTLVTSVGLTVSKIHFTDFSLVPSLLLPRSVEEGDTVVGIGRFFSSRKLSAVEITREKQISANTFSLKFQNYLLSEHFLVH